MNLLTSNARTGQRADRTAFEAVDYIVRIVDGDADECLPPGRQYDGSVGQLDEMAGTSIACAPHVNIRFTSSLTPADENILAGTVLKALTSILDVLPIAYMIRIDTTDSQVFQHSGPGTFAAPVAESTTTRSDADAPV